MKIAIPAGTTSKRIKILIYDSSSTTGAGLTGLVYNSSGLTWYYTKDGDPSATQVTLGTATLGTWASGGFVAVDGTNMPGVYELGIPNAAIAAGDCHMILKGATNMVPVAIEIQTTNLPANTQQISGTNQTARDLGASVLVSSGTGTGQLDITSGVVKANTTQVAGTAQTARDLGASVLLSVGTGTGQVNLSGGKVPATVAVGDIADNAITSAKIATDAIGAAQLASDAVLEIFAGVLTSQLTESYAADGTAPTLAQAIFLIQQSLHEFALSGTTRTVKKLDGSTTAAVFTLDSATSPTSTTRTS